MPCSLCNSTTRNFQFVKDRSYVQCTGCKAIFLSSEYHLSPKAEKQRYSLHNNDVEDIGYIQFVQPVIDRIKLDFDTESLGLDFGCGTGPVIASQLKLSGYNLKLYDPYFEPDKEVFKGKFDFIVCCEVMEHFQDPLKEFRLLRSILQTEGKLYCKTEVWDDAIDFQNWHYKNDLTHVIFYNKETLNWLKQNFEFSKLEIEKDYMVFTA
ncbi:class I SAM-dependent methyltransferase [Christiangramia sp. SM2212]|uniref:Class I SAM-dependent methyltransferase n=1 Tax=Christiangramia sediminicola TaxID=3073267 RepID=A0ABU1EN71_9FLAO|nr:class I SAM-dependent methyltransferase [Christiangramia sp. SM2212]MDR5589835.1 class I SAM-dependent methyltransferase [Christiangramia sp. SM2212]